MQAEWLFPLKKASPLSITYHPQLEDKSQSFLNPFFGYPICPIIGRYNRGQYKIGETLSHIEFKCKYNENTSKYECGDKAISIPEQMLFNLRTLPEYIINNKLASIKQAPDILPEKYPVRQQLSVMWVISFGQLGKDFLNYLNHMYILANTLFMEEKLQRKIHYLPIYAYLPSNSGLKHQEVDRGLNFTNYRGEYMSFHLTKGSPAFSPNNMRLGVQGGKTVTSKPAQKPKKESKKIKYIEKEKVQIKEKPQLSKEQQQQILNSIFQQLQKPEKQIKKSEKQQQQYNKVITQLQKQPVPKKNIKQGKEHQGYIHFYSSILLQEEYRVYYHWHIQDLQRQDILKQILRNSSSLQELILNYQKIFQDDPLFNEISHLFGVNNAKNSHFKNQLKKNQN